MTTAAAIAAALGMRKAGRARFLGDCPACGYADAFAAEDREDIVLVHCAACRDQDAVLAALRAHGLWGGAGNTPVNPFARARRAVERRDRERDASAQARRLWDAARPAAGTVVECYLRARAITLPPPVALRFLPAARHPATGTIWPCMIAAVEREGAGLVAVHRTFLRPGGKGKADLPDPRASLGAIRGGAVRLAQAGPILIVGEGIETTLSAMQLSGLPGWAALSTGGLRALILPEAVGQVVIAADHDEQGLAAAHDAARRWQSDGHSVHIEYPGRPGADFNDALNEARHDRAA